MSSPANVPASMGSGSPTPSGRRSSQSIAFAGLVNQKRNSIDAAAAARRASFNEMKPQAGFLGTMWHNWTQGHGAASK